MYFQKNIVKTLGGLLLSLRKLLNSCLMVDPICAACIHTDFLKLYKIY
jgi:hypothetical protein